MPTFSFCFFLFISAPTLALLSFLSFLSSSCIAYSPPLVFLFPSLLINGSSLKKKGLSLSLLSLVLFLFLLSPFPPPFHVPSLHCFSICLFQTASSVVSLTHSLFVLFKGLGSSVHHLFALCSCAHFYYQSQTLFPRGPPAPFTSLLTNSSLLHHLPVFFFLKKKRKSIICTCATESSSLQS